MAAAAILVFEKFEILTQVGFHQNRSNGCGDMAI